MKTDDAPIDLSKLAQEAAMESYSPRAKKCWPWSHSWTMWAPDKWGYFQKRNCVLCGIIRQKSIGWL